VITGKKLISLAVTEPYAGSDVANIKTTAVRDGDYYIVNGYSLSFPPQPFIHFLKKRTQIAMQFSPTIPLLPLLPSQITYRSFLAERKSLLLVA
jgi:hypothetical protein